MPALLALSAVALRAGSTDQRHQEYKFVQITDIHLEPFYWPEVPKQEFHGGTNPCRTHEAMNKSVCVPFEIERHPPIYPFGRINCDPPYTLLEDLLAHVNDIGSYEQTKPDFVIFTGDAPAHDLSCEEHLAKTVEVVAHKMAEELKPLVGTKIYPVMGNNDYFPDYNVSVHPYTRWQRLQAKYWHDAGLLDNTTALEDDAAYTGSVPPGARKGSQLDTYRRGGFYAVKPREGLRLLVLNTVVWSHKVVNWEATAGRRCHCTEVRAGCRKVGDACALGDEGCSEHCAYHVEQTRTRAPTTLEEEYRGPDAPFPGEEDLANWEFNEDSGDKEDFLPCDARPSDPFGQLAWMRQQLHGARAARDRVIIAGHVPPGDKAGTNNFCADHLRGLRRLTEEFAEHIEVQIYGDHSIDEFRMFWTEPTAEHPKPSVASSVLVSAGITPRKHCNPAWRLFDVSAEHNVRDYTQYILPLDKVNIEWGMNSTFHNMDLTTKGAAKHFWEKQYSFREEYGHGVKPADMQLMFAELMTNASLMSKYIKNLRSQVETGENYFNYICDMRYMDHEDHSLCDRNGSLVAADTAAALAAAARERVPAAPAPLHLPPGPKAGMVEVHQGVLGALIGTCALLAAATAALARDKLLRGGQQGYGGKDQDDGRPLGYGSCS